MHSSTAPGERYAFVRQAGVSLATLAIADADARRIGVATHEVLLSAGYLSHTAYASALARWLEAPAAGWEAVVDIEAPVDFDDPDERPLRGRMDGRPYIFLCAEAGMPEDIAARVAALRAQGLDVALSSRVRLEAAIEPALRASRLTAAVQGLHSRDPAFSAAGLIWLRQVIAAVVIVGLIVGGLWVAPEMTIAAVSAIIALPFLSVTLLRVAALREIVSGRALRVGKRVLQLQPLASRTLPVYSILVPLFREATVLPGLAQALQNLVYPKAKLEILLVLETADLETQAAVLRLRLPGNFRVVLVPERAPQTKPKALNYALQYARGDYIVVYDAEDRPEPDQLLRALAAFERLPADVGCLQAQLNIHNPYRSWLTRQFTVEYSALFDAILPALARLRLPVPLGGTSNHFRGL